MNYFYIYLLVYAISYALSIGLFNGSWKKEFGSSDGIGWGSFLLFAITGLLPPANLIGTVIGLLMSNCKLRFSWKFKYIES